MRWSFFLICLVCAINLVHAQPPKKIKKHHKKLLKEWKGRLGYETLNQFKGYMAPFNKDNVIGLFEASHYEGQMDLYLNDDFMFRAFGPIGKRDTAAIQNFYIREVIGLTQMEEETFLTKDVYNIFDIDNFSVIEEVFFAETSENEFAYEVLFFARTKSGKWYCGVLSILKENGKAIGPAG